MNSSEYEKDLENGYKFECCADGCNREIKQDDDWTFVSGNIYCSECMEEEWRFEK